jgi:transcription initiation factor TFIID subunit 10
MNKDIEMLNSDDLNSQYNHQIAQPQQQQLNGAYNSPLLNVPPPHNMNEENMLKSDLDEDEDEDSDEDDETNTDNNIKNINNKSNKLDPDDDLFLGAENETKTPGEILDEFCQKLEDINTTLPDSVINYYMRKSGFIVNDPKLVKIISIASQKFISEIVNDVWQRQRLKTKQVAAASTTNSTTGSGGGGGGTGNPTTSTSANDQKTNKPATGAAGVAAAAAAANNANNSASAAGNTAQLTLEDLTQVLADYGINVKKPYYFI